MPELSDEAKREIQDAIRIVREDRHYKMLTEIHGRTVPPPEPPKDPTNPTPPPATGDHPTDPPADPANPPKPEKVGLWWGRSDLYPDEGGTT